MRNIPSCESSSDSKAISLARALSCGPVSRSGSALKKNQAATGLAGELDCEPCARMKPLRRSCGLGSNITCEYQSHSTVESVTPRRQITLGKRPHLVNLRG